MSRVIGITGTIGAGKSAVGEILLSLGVPVIDTDLIVHELLAAAGSVRASVINRFGPGITNDASTIDRGKLGKIVFQDKKARRDLEAIVHPSVIAECRRRVEQLKAEPVVAILVPLLFEAGLQSQYDEIWAVVTDEDILRKRLRKRGRLSRAEIDRRLAAQLSQPEKSAGAQHTIDNSGTLDATKKQIEALLKSR